VCSSDLHTYGVNVTTNSNWEIDATVEMGEIYDATSGDFERIAVSGRVGYRHETISASLRMEARYEDGIDATVRDRNTYLVKARLKLKHNEDWRFVARLDAAFSSSDQDSILDGDFIEGSLGWAYRPANNDRLNALLKYTYLYDLPGPQQVNIQDQVLGPKQRSHIFSADFVYDLNERWSVGGKYGVRVGEISTDRNEDDFEFSTAQLAIVRADYHVINNWDITFEGRVLHLNEAEQTSYGALVGVYRHFGKNMKLGIGYNFGRFSDDLTDLTYDDQGVFINLVAKF